ncbi:MAG: SAM-dependent methyltransferase [Hyphomicrobiales bacterium]
MDLLITNTPQARGEDLATVRAVSPGFIPSKVLSITGGAHGRDALEEDGAVNAYTPQRQRGFERAAIGSSINLFDGEFALAFIRYVHDLLIPGGELTIVRTRASSLGVNGFLSTDRIARELGGRRMDGLGPRGDMVANVATAAHDSKWPPSVLRSYLDNFDQVTGARACHMLETARRGGADFALPPSSQIEALERRFGGTENAFRRQVIEVDAYFIDAARFKAPIVAHILATLLGRRAISIADVGSGPGVVPMELCLDERLAVEHAVAIDASPSFRATAEAMLRHLDLGGRFELATASAEDFRFQRRFDAISYISSLLHVRKDALSATVGRAWSALNLGGVLIVWENIRSPASVTQAEYMFTPGSIDAELRRLGPIRYFLTTAAKEIPADKVGDQTVFRVVQKPA